jgi:hypothetical protein
MIFKRLIPTGMVIYKPCYYNHSIDLKNSTLPDIWEEYQQKYQPIFFKLDNDLKSLRLFFDLYSEDELEYNMYIQLKKHPKKDKIIATSEKNSNGMSLETVKFIRKNGLDALCKQFCISTCRHSTFNNLIQLSSNHFSPGK